MKVLLIGSGGREHSLAWKISGSPILTKLYCAPGNPGISEVGTCVVLEIDNHRAVVRFCREKAIDLVIVGPEAPLVDGLADSLGKCGIAVFGPRAGAARLEGSKGFTKDLCARYDIPTARYQRFNNAPKAKSYVRQSGVPVVIKADGLAAGKGVVIATSLQQAFNAIDDCLEGAFGDAGQQIVIEEFLEGEEASFFCLCDGHTALPFGTAQDYKRAGEGDTGPNTGGMGAISPATIMNEDLIEQTMATIVRPTLRGMADMGSAFTGVLYAGLMITDEGPKLIEYNTRFGDPECQVLMLRLRDDILPLLIRAAEGRLDGLDVRWRDEVALCVVLASQGYPGAVQKGALIGIPEAVRNSGDAEIFHAGTAMDRDGLRSNGGRVLNVAALGGSFEQAGERAYRLAGMIDWPGGYFRRDIGWREISRAQE